jgi:ethanolamine permease
MAEAKAAWSDPGTDVEAGAPAKAQTGSYGVVHLCLIGIGAVISGDLFGWNFGLRYGWSSMLVATILVAVLYTFVCLSLAELSSLPLEEVGAVAFGTEAFGRLGGFAAGVGQHIE